jgi:transposase-like protein
MPVCEKCGSKAYVIDTRRKSSGDVRRRFRCKDCDCRWTEWNGVPPPRPIPEVRLSDKIILDILTDRSPQSVMSARHGCSFSTVGKVRRGELHANVHPEIPRFKDQVKTGRKTCPKCDHYTGSPENPCGLGHIDPIEEGLTFASYCSTFKPIASTR